MASRPAGRSTRESPGRARSGSAAPRGTIDDVGRRDSKETDVYVPPAAGTTLQTSGRRIPLRHSDAPDYDAVSVTEEEPRSRAGLWLLVVLLIAAGLGVAAWRLLA